MLNLNGDLTVGYVAGFIAAAIVVARFICPAILAYLMASVLRDTETASTWTAAEYSISSSIWPYLLRVDGGGVRPGIRALATVVPIISILISVAGIVTPLGLGQQIIEMPSVKGDFEYVADTGPYYFGTSPRGANFSRYCGQGFRSVACPFSNTKIITLSENKTGATWDIPDGYNMTIPDTLVKIFSSGTPGRRTTVSNLFDIEWRQLSAKRSEEVGTNKPYAVGMFHQLASYIMDGGIKLVEGLVIDAQIGGIGFRNHTVPVGQRVGATWEEDILFIEPVSTCVDTNLSINFKLTTDWDEYKNFSLIDRGGFHSLNHTYPYYDRSDPQSNPDLWGRAYKAAWLHNAYTMSFLNVTNPRVPEKNLSSFSYLDSYEGKGFSLNQSSLNYRSLSLSYNFGINLPLTNDGKASPGSSWSNPWNVTTEQFGDINILCSGAGGADIANISSIYVGCGLLRAAPRRINDGPAALFDDGSEWQSPLLTCATGVRAIIKTVTFSMNGTQGLDSLSVKRISPKNYDSDDGLPTWGVEKFGLTLAGYNPAWGLISPEYGSWPNISSLRAPHLYLPGYDQFGSNLISGGGGTTSFNLPGTDFAMQVMSIVLDFRGPLISDWPFDLRGMSNMAILRRWQNLSHDPAKAGHIINLVWTDLAASAVVGTKGTLGHLNRGKTIAVQIRPYGYRITFNFLFGIPAFILGAALTLLISGALLATCFGGAGYPRLRLRTRQLTIGRVLTTFLYPQESNLTMDSSEWRKINGKKTVTLDVIAQRGAAAETLHYHSIPASYSTEMHDDDARKPMRLGANWI